MVRRNNVTNKYQTTNIIEHIVLKLVSYCKMLKKNEINLFEYFTMGQECRVFNEV